MYLSALWTLQNYNTLDPRRFYTSAEVSIGQISTNVPKWFIFDTHWIKPASLTVVGWWPVQTDCTPAYLSYYWSKGWWRWWVVTTGLLEISRAKLQSNHHHQQTNIQFFTGRMPFLSHNQQCQSIEGKISHSMHLLIPSSPSGLPTLSLTTNCSWLPWGGLPCLSTALWCQYPCTLAFL